VACDVTDHVSVDAAFTQAEAAAGPVSVLVANAGITSDQLLMRMSEAEFGGVVDTNLAGSWRVLKRASTGMIRARYGRVVLIGSVVGMYGGPGQANYAASKAGLVGLARSVTRELGSRGITVNVVAPGFIDTDMTAELDDKRRRRTCRRSRPGASARSRTSQPPWRSSWESRQATSAVRSCRSTAASAWVTDSAPAHSRRSVPWVCSTASSC
jgi:3-oxoacyl-[acyl-carrier protein] reductase